ncbi:MAG: lipoprotein-releasing ABC transporter permease subunit [Neisseriaceae bacterium]|nr:lipoprotein-releasing ABC transporter permease subunit [Neisseriaceae bacterium]MBP6861124.1 lipoprotein-releasing ABC transporter permease subunit [Neisseriaceae bacterium]
MASLETWIGLRYLRAKKRNGFVSFISLVSVLGIALGVMALIVVLSVMNGFQKEIRGQLLNVAPHVEVGYFSYEEHNGWQSLAKQAQERPEVISTAPYIAEQGLLVNSGIVRGAQIKGIDPVAENTVVDYGKNMPIGQFSDLKPGEFGIVLGQDLAQALGANMGDKVTVITPEGNNTPAGMVPRLKRFTVVGLVKTKVFEMDSTLAMIHLADAQVLFHYGEDVSGVRLKIKDPQNAPSFLRAFMTPERQTQMWAEDWTAKNRSYFEAVELEKRMMFIILTLIIAVAAFNLVSSLVMAVNEKQADIAILRTVGLSPRGIMKIFMIQGAISGFMGTLAGVFFGVLAAYNIGFIVSGIEKLLGRQLINSQIYFLDYLPSDVRLNDVLVIAVVSLVLSFLATLYPSYRASKTQPAEALRYE